MRALTCSYDPKPPTALLGGRGLSPFTYQIWYVVATPLTSMFVLTARQGLQLFQQHGRQGAGIVKELRTDELRPGMVVKLKSRAGTLPHNDWFTVQTVEDLPRKQYAPMGAGFRRPFAARTMWLVRGGEIAPATNKERDIMPEKNETPVADAGDQISANIERIRTLSIAGEADAAAALFNDTETLISGVVKADGKADTAKRKKYRADAAEARKAQPPVTPSSEVATVADAAIIDDYHSLPKAVELVSMGADKVREGISAGLKVSSMAREVASIMMDIRLSIHTKQGLPDLKATRQATRDSHSDIYDNALASMDIDPGQRELVLKTMRRGVNYQMSDVLVRWVEALDNSPEAYAELFGPLAAKYPDLSPTEAVRTHYNISDKSEIDKAREREQEKAALAAKAKELEAAGEAPEGGEGDGDSEGGSERTPRLFANLNAMKEANEKAAENVKAVKDAAQRAEAREQIQARMTELASLLAALG